MPFLRGVRMTSSAPPGPEPSREAPAAAYRFPRRDIVRLPTLLRRAPVKAPTSALLISIPKSGTVFLHNTLASLCSLKSMIISNQYFPEDQIRLDEIQQFARGSHIASTHLDPNPANLQLLDAYVPRWHVHFRDPRSVVLSWTHHLFRLRQEGREVEWLRVVPSPPPNYGARGFAEQVDWQIEHFLPSVIAWMEAWVPIADRHPDRILLTEFKDLVADGEGFARRIATFLDLPLAEAAHRPIEKTMDRAHFRTGTLDEWQTAFTPAQIERINVRIPAGLAERFGWTLA